MKTLLIKIIENNQMIYNGENPIILNNIKQYILKDIITKFGFGLKTYKVSLYMMKYRVNINHGF